MKYGVIIAVVIYELIVILGCAAYLKVKERKKAAAGVDTESDFATGGRSMGVIVLAPTIALTVLGSAHITGVFEMSYGMGAMVLAGACYHDRSGMFRYRRVGQKTWSDYSAAGHKRYVRPRCSDSYKLRNGRPDMGRTDAGMSGSRDRYLITYRMGYK